MINIIEFTKGDLKTETIQKAIDYAAQNEKFLLFPKGKYVVSTLFLKTNSMLYLEEGAVIEASTKEEDWLSCDKRPLIFCKNQENIKIMGKGTISCSGYAFTQSNGERGTYPRPEQTVVIRNSKNISITDITIIETVGWSLHLDNCDDAIIDGVKIKNPPYHLRKNSDGIDINGCRNVTLTNCDIETGDDAICLKNVFFEDTQKVPLAAQRSFKREDMYNINVYNCTVATTCNGVKIGTESVGDIYNISFNKITVKKHSMITRDAQGTPPTDMINPMSAISIQSNDGAKVYNIKCNDFYVEYAYSPIFMLYQKRLNRFKVDLENGYIENVDIKNVYVKKAYLNSQILSQEKGKIRGVNISSVYAETFEPKSEKYDPKIPTGNEYPDPYNFGKFPAYGLYSENADININENVTFIDREKTERESIIVK